MNGALLKYPDGCRIGRFIKREKRFFVSVELDAWARLFMVELGEENDEARQTLHEAREWLVQEHMARWLPAFLERAAQSSPSPLMADILKTLENWLHAAKENV